jgi:hypothetical protein
MPDRESPSTINSNPKQGEQKISTSKSTKTIFLISTLFSLTNYAAEG